MKSDGRWDALELGELARDVAGIIAVDPLFLGRCIYCNEEHDHNDFCPWWRLKRLVEAGIEVLVDIAAMLPDVEISVSFQDGDTGEITTPDLRPKVDI